MTDTLKGCIVLFDKDVREDDAQRLLDLIDGLKGVQAVTSSIVTPDDWMNRERMRAAIERELWEALKRND